MLKCATPLREVLRGLPSVERSSHVDKAVDKPSTDLGPCLQFLFSSSGEENTASPS